MRTQPARRSNRAARCSSIIRSRSSPAATSIWSIRPVNISRALRPAREIPVAVRRPGRGRPGPSAHMRGVQTISSPKSMGLPERLDAAARWPDARSLGAGLPRRDRLGHRALCSRRQRRRRSRRPRHRNADRAGRSVQRRDLERVRDQPDINRWQRQCFLYGAGARSRTTRGSSKAMQAATQGFLVRIAPGGAATAGLVDRARSRRAGCDRALQIEFWRRHASSLAAARRQRRAGSPRPRSLVARSGRGSTPRPRSPPTARSISSRAPTGSSGTTSSSRSIPISRCAGRPPSSICSTTVAAC